ncbi:MAG: 1-(5-phosphoribosyl)-5-[(5-phosphoribosylamino)methylideneamino]imidazole-4-carboxamide isomerase [Candidatus Omnitrophica bacterium]|nr:1-(5-phosphoribosyl)-5-[(5-phosphoribosylamino)methylideneamino]imidazole-4-carboxamide isomerase [Candidatus Omnitrophota bacterium]
MIIIPAIDLKDQKVVRLTQGKFDQKTEYNHDPVSIAQKWQSCGAQLIHIVDLDGAEKGISTNFDIIKKIKESIDVPIEVGGGIRNKETIQRFADIGISRIILGTKAVEDFDFIKDVLSKWDNQIAVSLDCANGMVATKGWAEVSSIQGKDLAQKLEQAGLKTLIYTDIARDGALVGPNIKQIQEILNTVNLSVIASGGISSLDDIKNILSIKAKNLYGVIIGKALYENKFDLKEAIALCSQNV